MSSAPTATPPVESDLASLLVSLSRECESPVERLRAQQLVRDAKLAWPGEESQQWRRWLTESCRCLNLHTRPAELTLAEAKELAEDGAALVGAWTPERGPVVLMGSEACVFNAADTPGGVPVVVGEDLLASEDEEQTTSWLLVEHAERIDAQHEKRLAHKPIARLLQILRPEWNDIWIILVFAFFAGVLSLSTPIAVEALVNTVAFGRLLQPVVVLAAILFGFLTFAAVMMAMQTYVAEVIQRRLFARVAADLAHRLPRVDAGGLDGAYGPELVNRFLDVVTLQKVVAQLLLDGVSLVLAALVGMTVLAFYHPWLLGFDVLLLGLIVAGLYVLGRGAINTGIDESKLKFKLTSWFEDLMRCRAAFKSGGGAEFAADRANLLTSKYLNYRSRHFGVLFRQIVFVLGLQAVAGTVLLGGGGWLVIQGQLSLGQLIAAELIVSMILSSLAKIGKHLEGFYDVVAAVDKLGVLFDLPVERHDGLMVVDAPREGLPVKLTDVRVAGASGELGDGLSLRLAPGEQLALLGPSGVGKTALCRLLYGEGTPAAGRIAVAGLDPADARPDVLRSHVGFVGEPEIFEGTLADNVHLRRPGVGPVESRAALESVGLLDKCLGLANGLDTPLTPAAKPLSGGQQRLLMFARAIAGAPRLLVVDGALDGLADAQLERVLHVLMADSRVGTLVVATGRRDIAERFGRVVALDGSGGKHDSQDSLTGGQR